VERACIGVAGAGSAEILETIRKIVAEMVPGVLEVVGDMQIALTAAFGEGPGVMVIAGTGSIVHGRDEQGRTARAGGWGFAISDEGSAHWIGRAAVSAALRAVDQSDEDQAKPDHAQPASALFRGLTAAWRLESLSQLASAANAHPDFATLFPAVVTAAESGDAVAREVMTQASRELVQLARIVVRRLFPDSQSSASSAVPMAMAGGVFRYASMIRDLFSNGVCTEVRNVVLNPEVVDPVQGALQMARRASS
jgi:N-acetylglucosamine kinase-like BadF-type ATPase